MTRHSASETLRPRGAYSTLQELIALRFPAAQLQPARRKRALSVLAGPNKSNFRGRGIDFEEVRAYQPGDDIRTIDWRVTARTGSAHTKLFHEERERPVLLVIDQRSSLFFGSRNCFKSVLAAHIGALLGWAALACGDRVGALIFNEHRHREIRPRRSRKTVLGILSELQRFNSELPLEQESDHDSFARMLGELRRIARPGSSVYLVSDFQGATSPAARKHLFQLAQHSQVTALSCNDSLEMELPAAGRYAVTDGEGRAELSTASPALRRLYRARASERAQLLESELRRLGIPLLPFHTGEPPLPLLLRYYGEERR